MPRCRAGFVHGYRDPSLATTSLVLTDAAELDCTAIL